MFRTISLRISAIVLSLLLFCFPLFGQEGGEAAQTAQTGTEEPAGGDQTAEGQAAESQADEGQAGGTEEPAPSAIVPVFPQETPGIIYIEGEDAVSTNFTLEATYNYSCSGMKALQLSRTTGLQGGAPFYAQFALYAEEAGTYELWYAGTPPGPRDELDPSFSSPFRYSIDDGTPVPCYREDVAVVETYTPSFYWVRVGTVFLNEGTHTFRIEVTEKRRSDGKFLFYLDSFFLFDPARAETEGPHPGIPMFPKNMADRSIDHPFQSIAVYQKAIQDNPDSIRLYKDLSMVFSLTGDYISALRNLRKAYALDPSDTETILLLAKNTIWKGDISEGLNLYEELLTADPSKPALWAEAGKVASWTSNYQSASWFFEEGLKLFPDNLSLEVNYGLTGLWMSDQKLADLHMGRAREIAGDDPDKTAELARIYMLNGYPEYATALLEEAIVLLPQHLELYLLLQQGYEKSGNREKAEGVYTLISSTFEPDPALSRYLDLYRDRQGLKERILDEYRQQIADDPANLELRTTLAQTYFWNGMKERGIDETRNILVNHGYNGFLDFDRDSMDLFSLTDRYVLFRNWFSSVPPAVDSMRKDLAAFLSLYKNAVKGAAKEQARADKGETPGNEARDLLIELKREAARLFGSVEGYLAHYRDIEEKLSSLGEELASYMEAENQDSLVFERLTRDLSWEWKRDRAVSELAEDTAKETVLAPYLLGRIYQMEGRYAEAENAFALTGDEMTTAARFAAEQTSRWDPTRTIEAELPGSPAALEYAPYLVDLSALKSELETVDEGQTLLPDDILSTVDGYVTRLDELKRNSALRAKEAATGSETLRAILYNRLVRIHYYIEENTYLIRYELGDYYLAAGEPEQAVYQFEKVLDIDPWNISALYKLGTVQQLSGRWARAMESYLKVYYSDPNYLNTAAYYNQLARQHADSFSASAQTFCDTSRINYLAEAAYLRQINSWIGITAGYRENIDKLYRPESTETTGMLEVKTVTIGFPLSFGTSGFGIKPYGGASFSNTLVSTIPSATTDFSSSPDTVLDELLWSPIYGVQVSYRRGAGSLSVTGGYERKKDTWFPGRNEVNLIFGETEFSSYITFPRNASLNSVSTRTYGRLDFMSDDNLIGTAVQEGILSLRLSDKPLVNLDITATVSYEHSRITPVTDYYAPESVLALKGGLRLGMFRGLKSGDVVSLTIWLIPGGYAEKLGTGGEGMQFMSEGDLTAAYYRGNSGLYIRVYGDGTFERGNFPETSYWAGLVSLGFTTQLPNLLAK